MDEDKLVELDSRIVKAFGSHFLSLTCDHCDPTTSKAIDQFVTSGFLLSINDIWFLATAGHVIDQIMSLIDENPNRTFYFAIVDNFGVAATHQESIPFDFKGALKWRTVESETDADFGLVMIEPHYRRLIEANKPTPFSEQQWRYKRDEPFEFHVIMGIPAETFKKGNPTRKDFELVIIPVTEITELPPSIPPRPFPTFYAELGPTPHIKSIEGMSGCPIFGFAQDREGHWRYWLVAVQSGWYYQRMPRIIYASRFKELAASAEAFFFPDTSE